MNDHPSTTTTAVEPFDDTAKTFYRQWFEKCGLQVETEREIFFRGRSIDLVVSSTTPEQRQQLQPTLFKYFRRVNALELKGIHDPLTVKDYNRILMRAWGLGAVPLKNAADTKHDKYLNQLPSQRTLTIVCVSKPSKILNLSKEFHFLPTADNGIYHSAGKLDEWIIYPSELDLVPANYPLLPLARGKKLADFLDLCFQEGLLDYITLTLSLGLLTDAYTVWQKLFEVQRMKVSKADSHEAVIPHIERYFETYPEDLKRLSITHALLEEQRQQGMQQGLQQGVQQGMQQGIQQGIQQGMQQGIQQGLQQGLQQQTKKMLLRYLRQKFAEIPASLVQRIETTNNLEQLETWAMEVLMANSLADLSIMPLANQPV